MTKSWIMGAMVALAIILGTFAVLFAQGAPTQPIVSNDTTLNPAVGQAVSVEVEYGFYSVSSPNTVWGPGLHVIYSAVESNLGGTPILLQNQQLAAPQIQSNTGMFYVMFVVLNFNTQSLCSGVACAGVVENLTITAQANTVTPYATWYSPTTVATFLSTQVGCGAATPCGPMNTAAPSISVSPSPSQQAQNTFYAELFVPLTLLAALELLLGYVVVMKHAGLAVAGLAALGLVAAEVLVFGWV